MNILKINLHQHITYSYFIDINSMLQSLEIKTQSIEQNQLHFLEIYTCPWSIKYKFSG